MKYYIKATNTRTNKTMIMPSPVFTSRAAAEEFAEKFVKAVCNSKMEVITEKER